MMKFNGLFLGAVLCLSTATAMAQTGASTGTPYGSGADSVNCRKNLSLFSSYAKSGDFESAYEPWQAAYKDCPASSKNIYIYGARILAWKIEQEKDPAKRTAIINELMKLYDTRIQYFGDDPKYGADVVTANKISDYNRLVGKDVDYPLEYGWAKKVIDDYKEQSNPQLLYFYAYASRAIALKDESKREDYIKDYLLVEDYLDKQIEQAAGDSVLMNRIEEFKNPLEMDFVQSGLASCDLLKKVYTVEKIDANKTDKAFLKATTILFQFAECDDPAYTRASRYLFDLEPSAGAAMRLAQDALSDKKYSEGMEYLQKAVEYSKNTLDRAKCYEVMAQISMAQGNYSAARGYASKALSENPRSGKSQIIMAQMLASSATSLFSDKVKQRCVFYLVIDKLRAAASADPSVANEANRLIATYSRQLPSASDVFMHPELKQGASFTVPGYGTTTIR